MLNKNVGCIQAKVEKTRMNNTVKKAFKILMRVPFAVLLVISLLTRNKYLPKDYDDKYLDEYISIYFRSKLFLLLVVFSLICWVLAGDSSYSLLIFMGILAFVPWYNYKLGSKWMLMMKDSSLCEYKDSHPECVHGRRVSCYECGGDRIYIKSVGGETNMQKHICTQCGKALYYSKIDE